MKEDPELAESVLTICLYIFNEVDNGHQWCVEWKKIREALVRGMDKYRYFELVCEHQHADDDNSMREANEWIKKHNFNEYTEDFIELGDGAGYIYENENEERHCSKKH